MPPAPIHPLPQPVLPALARPPPSPMLPQPVTDRAIRITAISATRVSGTFSGRYKAQKGSPATAKPTILISDGKFDIPFSTSAAMKKLNQAE